MVLSLISSVCSPCLGLGIGLEPVVVQSTPSKKERKTLSTRNDFVGQLSQNDINPSAILRQLSPPTISLRTQLDYSRRGHAVLRSFLPSTLVKRLRSELVPHAASCEISAWRQKVEVQLANSSDEQHRENARAIADKIQSVEACREMLEGLGLDPIEGGLPFLQHFNSWRADENHKKEQKDLLKLHPENCASLHTWPKQHLYCWTCPKSACTRTRCSINAPGLEVRRHGTPTRGWRPSTPPK